MEGGEKPKKIISRRAVLKLSLTAVGGAALAAAGIQALTDNESNGKPSSYEGDVAEIQDAQEKGIYLTELRKKFGIEFPGSDVMVFSLAAIDDKTTTRGIFAIAPQPSDSVNRFSRVFFYDNNDPRELVPFQISEVSWLLFPGDKLATTRDVNGNELPDLSKSTTLLTINPSLKDKTGTIQKYLSYRPLHSPLKRDSLYGVTIPFSNLPEKVQAGLSSPK